MTPHVLAAILTAHFLPRRRRVANNAFAADLALRVLPLAVVARQSSFLAPHIRGWLTVHRRQLRGGGRFQYGEPLFCTRVHPRKPSMSQTNTRLSNDNDESSRHSAGKARSRKKKKRRYVRGSEPHWMPRGISRKLLPREVRADIATLVNPIYEELVLNAKSGLAKSTGLTIVHLMWLEILDQIKLSPQSDEEDLDLDFVGESAPHTREHDIERHLRLVQSKLKASDLLLRMEQLKLQSRAARSGSKTSKSKRANKPDRPDKPR